MPDQSTIDAAANAELDHLIATTMHLLGASSAYDLKPRDPNWEYHPVLGIQEGQEWSRKTRATTQAKIAYELNKYQ